MFYACDARWWRAYGREAATHEAELWASYGPQDDAWPRVPEYVRQRLQHIEVSCDGEYGLSRRPGRLVGGLNSGYQAIGLAYQWGAATIVLLGYDMQRTNGKSHWHGDHDRRQGFGGLGNLQEWARRTIQLGIDLREQGVRVINSSRQTAIRCFERLPIDKALRQCETM